MLSEYDSGSDEGLHKSENLANVIFEWSVGAGGGVSVVRLLGTAATTACHVVGFSFESYAHLRCILCQKLT